MLDALPLGEIAPEKPSGRGKAAASGGAVWIDMGGGTGQNVEYMAKHLQRFSKVCVGQLARLGLSEPVQ